ncbi:MAG: hypothetical protein WC758_05755 [Candidatus Woesearchaeota archaeon]|jgi:hypothetical protein
MEYFTKINEPRKLRISLMTAAKESVVLLSMLEDLYELRRTKIEVVKSIKDDFKELNILCSQLANLVADEKTRKEVLEAIKLSASSKDVPSKKSEVLKLPTEKKDSIKNVKNTSDEVKVSEIKKKTEVDRLEYTLSQIEQKLADLNS